MATNVSNDTIPEEPTPETEPPCDENAEEKMTNSWEAARASLGSITGSSNSAQSNPQQQQQPKQKQQKHFPAPAVPSGGGGSYNYFDGSFNANATIDRTSRRLRRASYANRSFMYHGEYHHGGGAERVLVADTFGDTGGTVGRLPYFVEPTYRSLEYDRRQRRRHSVHQLASTNPSKLDDLRQRFDEYNSSAAIPRSAYYGYYTLDRHQQRSRQVANSPSPLGVVHYGKPLVYGQGARYSGSRSLDRYLAEEERNQTKGPKRGSRSSQGSTDSNNSSHSASSGSLLLTVANLETFAKIHRKSAAAGSSKLDGSSRTLEKYLASTLDLVPHHGTIGRRSRYNSNILLPHNDEDEDEVDDDAASGHPADHAAIDYRKDALHQLGTTIVPIDEISIDEGEGSGNGSEQQLQVAGPGGATTSLVSPFRSLKAKDPDSVSVASSTHFTMVNGVGGPQRVPKSGICSSGHQITILIMTMSFIFMIGICAAVFLLEMRARDMPK